MRVCLVSPYDLTQDGGVQAQVLGLAGWLMGRGDEVRIIAPRLPGGLEGVEVGRVVRVRANRSVAPICLSPRVSVRMKGTLDWGEVAHIHEPLMPWWEWRRCAFGVRGWPPSTLTRRDG